MKKEKDEHDELKKEIAELKENPKAEKETTRELTKLDETVSYWKK